MIAAAPEPSRHQILHWVRLNLALGLAILTLLAGFLGGLISTTRYISAYENKIDNLVTSADDGHTNMVSVNQRLNEIHEAVAVLQGQVTFLVGRAKQDSAAPAPPPGHGK
jgi:hypothetical protein